MQRYTVSRVGAVCAVVYVVVVAAALVLFSSTDLLDAEDADQVLPILDDDRAVVLTAGWLLVIAPIVLAFAALGLLMMLQRAGSLMWVAAMAFVAGSFLVLLRNIIWLALAYELAPAYVDAAGTEQVELAAVGDTLLLFGLIVGDLVGGVLVAGVGVALFSAAILHTKVAPSWVAWVGFFAAVVGGWLTLLSPASEVIEGVTFLGLVGFFVWLVALAPRLWRWSGPAA